MSLTKVRPLFRSTIDALGYKEWRDYINFENIPSTLFDKSYHLQTDSIGGSTASQLVYTFSFDLNVRLFRKSYNDTVEVHEQLISDVENIHTNLLELITRTRGDVFDIVPTSTTFDPLFNDVDNWQMATVGYSVIVKMCF